MLVAAALAVGSGAGAIAVPVSAGACSMAGLTVDFDGTVVAIDGPRVTYRVDRVRADNEVEAGLPPGTPGRIPEPGKTVVVNYDEPTRLVVLDEAYRVEGWNHEVGEVGSQIAYDFQGDCGTGRGTTALDGSYLGPAAKGLDRYWRRALVGLLVIGGAILGVHAFVARRQDRGWHYT